MLLVFMCKTNFLVISSLVFSMQLSVMIVFYQLRKQSITSISLFGKISQHFPEKIFAISPLAMQSIIPLIIITVLPMLESKTIWEDILFKLLLFVVVIFVDKEA